MKFQDFILNEDKAYLGQRLGDILNALQDLSDNCKGMGTRYLTISSERIVNQIRRVLHTNWPKQEEEILKSLQKIGVGIMKAIEEKDDLETVIHSATQELDQVLNGMNVPINKLATPPDKGEKSPKEPGENKEGSPAPKNTNFKPMTGEGPPPSDFGG